ncbi:MAG TPA: hypothetical protein VGO58_14195 [Chitinophagaceae bacterium]|nr:hypothetical protein [Chitinophagaceae bacterium]
MRPALFLVIASCFCQQVIAQYTIETVFYPYRNGELIKNSKGEVATEVYNAANQIVERRSAHFANQNRKTLYTYNEKGKLAMEEDFLNDSSTMKRYYQYNEKDQLATMSYKTYNKKYNDFDLVEYYFYDFEGRLETVKRTSGGYSDNQTVTYKYETRRGQNLCIELTQSDHSKKPFKRTTAYNEKGLIISHSIDGNKYKYEYEYDEKGEWVKRRVCRKQSGGGSWQWTGESIRRRIN